MRKREVRRWAGEVTFATEAGGTVEQTARIAMRACLEANISFSNLRIKHNEQTFRLVIMPEGFQREGFQKESNDR